MSSIDAATAFIALLAADPNLKVYDGRVPVDPVTGKLPARPYVVIYAPTGLSSIYNLAGQSGALSASIQTTCVGDTAESCRIVARRVKADVLDVVPAVTGRISYPIRHDDSRPVERDDDVQPPVLFAVDRWLTQSVPA